MSKCKSCGKSGLFFRVNADGLCNSCANKMQSSFSDPAQGIHQKVEKQNIELTRLVKAEEAYDNDKDVDKLIAEYEDVFITQKSTLNSQSRWFKLVDLYLRTGQKDKAWAWLNQLAIQHPECLSKIEDKRYRILNSEGRLLDAMLSLMASIGYAEGNNGPMEYYQMYGRNRFLKAAPSLIKKLKWSTNDLNLLEAMLASCIGETKFNFSALRGKYKRFIESKKP